MTSGEPKNDNGTEARPRGPPQAAYCSYAVANHLLSQLQYERGKGQGQEDSPETFEGTERTEGTEGTEKFRIPDSRFRKISKGKEKSTAQRTCRGYSLPREPKKSRERKGAGKRKKQPASERSYCKVILSE